jgi:hypothetical protein
LRQADDVVGVVHSVGVDGRHADRCEVVRDVSSRVELAVLGAVAAASFLSTRYMYNDDPPLTGVRLHPPGRADRQETLPMLRCPGSPGFP